MNRHTKHAIFAGGAACVAVTLLAQGTNPPAFSTSTRLIEISVAATDNRGPVLDLDIDDFRIRDNGRDETIRFFVAPDALRSSRNPGPTAEPASASQPGSAVILLDLLNTGWAEQAYARVKTLDMLSAIGLTDRVAMFANMRRLEVVHDFTENNAALLESLSALRPTVDAPSENVIFGTRDLNAIVGLDAQIRADATKRNVAPVIGYLGKQPGRKSLIWVSQTFGMAVSDLIRDLVRANITLYLVDTRGVQVGPLPPSGPASRATDFQRTFETRMELERRRTNKTLAEATGGVYFENRNDLDGAMREALAETRTSYTLGYYLPEDAKPGEHKIRIGVNRRGVKLRYRESYTVDRPAAK